jgi:tetratricopeptide (TPR) repeat protein
LSFVLRDRDAAAADRASREAVEILERLINTSTDSDYKDDLAICYNNRAALKSQDGNWNDAIVWHLRAIELQEQLVRKSTAVVRHRSELAVSLNNLGVAYCRTAKPAEADAAFGRARELFATLANDYPDELAYSSSLAALLNNQGLALASVGRHADALKIYPAAIEAQRHCRDKGTDSEAMRQLLSKMYYNYGQSLKANGQIAVAVQAALDRRELWKGNGERLLGVASELAELDASVKSRPAASSDVNQKDVTNDVLATLDEAYKSGLPAGLDLAKDERFASLRKNERFAAKIAEFNERTQSSATNKLNHREGSRTKTN